MTATIANHLHVVQFPICS